MEKLLVKITGTSIYLGLAYLICCLIEFKFNPAAWHLGTRVGLGIVAFLFIRKAIITPVK